MEKTLAIIGLGGGGGWLIQLLSKSEPAFDKVLLVDGDKVEKKNLNRQMFTDAHIGYNKAEASLHHLSAFPGAKACPEYLAYDTDLYKALASVVGRLVVACCVDNHPARNVCLVLADERLKSRLPTVVVFAGNEYETASAFTYCPAWKDGPMDPRVRWPEIKTDTEGDPLLPPCSGEALASNPRLALSNMISAVSAAWLIRFWSEVAPKLMDGCPEAEAADLYNTFPIWLDWTNGTVKLHAAGHSGG